MVGHCRKHAFAINGNRPGSLMASDHLEQHLSLALVDEPMAQLHVCGQLLRRAYDDAHVRTSGGSEVGPGRFWPLASAKL